MEFLNIHSMKYYTGLSKKQIDKRKFRNLRYWTEDKRENIA